VGRADARGSASSPCPRSSPRSAARGNDARRRCGRPPASSSDDARSGGKSDVGDLREFLSLLHSSRLRARRTRAVPAPSGIHRRRVGTNGRTAQRDHGAQTGRRPSARGSLTIRPRTSANGPHGGWYLRPDPWTRNQKKTWLHSPFCDKLPSMGPKVAAARKPVDDPIERAFQEAPLDDHAETAEEREAMAEARADVRWIANDEHIARLAQRPRRRR
jgi:hypothetical protein